MKNKLLLLIIVLSASRYVKAQNCTINSGVDQIICLNEPMNLLGFRSGLFKLPVTSTWTQIGGPSVIIASPNSLSSAVTGFSANQTYTFRISTTCRDGVKAFDDVKISVLPITTAFAGIDQTACPGSSALLGNLPGVNESGNWTIVSSNNAGVAINNAGLNNSTFTTSVAAAGQSTLRWTISNTNGCSSFDNVVITNYGGFSPVNTNTHFVTLGNCYSTTQCYNLNATFGGGGFGGQQGTWSQVSGPSNVNFSNINSNTSNVCGLISGCYKLRWTVVGPCVNGSDTIRICVPPPTQGVTVASVPNQVFCDGRTVALLSGNAPIFADEKVRWLQTGGPTTVVFSEDSAYNTVVTNLNGSSQYTFTYTIRNTKTGCTNVRTATIGYTTPPSLSNFRDTLLPCNITAVSIPFTASGGNQTTYQIMSAPLAWGATPGGQIVTNSPLVLTGLTTSGSYVIRMRRTTDQGVECADITRDFSIIVSRTALGANAGTNQFLPCNVNFTNLAGNLPARGFGTWSVVSGPSLLDIDDIYGSNTLVNGFIRGTYVFKWTVNAGTKCPKAEDLVTVIFAPTTPQAVAAGTNRTICFGGPIKLDGNVPDQGETGTWSLVSGSAISFSNVNDPKAIVTGTVANSVYVFKWKVVNLCGADSSTVTITTNNQNGPPQAFAGNDRCLASGTAFITLNGNNPLPASGLWSQISGPAASFSNDTLFNSNGTGLVNGTYLFEWQNTRGSCEPTRDTVQITISGNASMANAGANIDSCGSSTTLNATPVTVGIGTWVQVQGPSGWSITNINSPTARLTNLLTGEYKFAWVVTNGACVGNSDTVTINIDNLPGPPIIAGNPQKLCGLSSLTLSGNRIKGGTAIWSLVGLSPNAPNIIDPDSATTIVNGLITGIYNFKRTTYSVMGICANIEAFVSDTVVLSANAGVDQGFCNQKSTAVIGPKGSIGNWTQATGSPAVITTTSANTALITGLTPVGSPYSFAYTVPLRWGCAQTTDTMVIIISDTTVVPYAGLDQQICNAALFNLSGSNLTPNTSEWTKTFGPAGTITSPTSQTTTVTGITYGLYLFTWAATNGFCTRADEMRIENFEPPTTANAGADSTICPPRVRMRANNALIGVGLWRQVSGPVSAIIEEPVNPATVINGMTATGTYRFVWEIKNGPICTPTIDTIAIFVPSLNPTTAIAGIDSGICVRTISRLNGNNPSIGTGVWSQYTLVPTSTIANSSTFNSNLTLSTQGVYGFVWTVTNGSCVSTDTTLYTLSDLPTTATADPVIDACIGKPVVLNGNNPTSGTGTWQQVSGTNTVTFSDSTNNNAIVLGLNIGSYSLRWRIANGACPNSDALSTVNIVAQPAIAIAGARQVICQDFTSLTGSTDSIGTGLWSNVSGPNVPTITPANTENTTITGMINGNYTFKWAITNGGCVNEDTVNVSYTIPMVNNTCSAADSLVFPSYTSGLDSLCAATAQIGEPSTCGKAACNSNMYKFTTNNSLWYQSITVNFTNVGSCPGNLRASIFNNGACPALGTQLGTCQTIASPGTLVFNDLAPATLYYLIVDDNSAVCGFSTCKYRFEISGAPLPVNFLSFKGALVSNDLSKLSWTTAGEETNTIYEIERRVEHATSFTKVGKVNGFNTSGVNNYNFMDNVSTIDNSNIYYRIKSIDASGNFKYSNTITLRKNSSGINAINVYPNPSSGIYNLKVNTTEETEALVTVTNVLGEVVFSKNLNLNNGLNTQLIDLQANANGVYFITIQNESYKSTVKLMLME